MKQLPADTVRLLSSSQVVTSVGNVVKELMENSLDAGASSIQVKLENFGLDRIEVRDNGYGIKAVDAPVMAVRHFTSKICSHEDLDHLETYGFRGEALGSVCAVAEVSVTTKTTDDDISTQYTLDSTGRIVSQKPSHLGQGTTVSVTRLFKNLPVRRQYYSSTKKCKEEVKKVQDLLVAYALIRPELRLVLLHNKVVVWQKAAVADDRSALLATLGPGAVANLLPCHRHQEQPEIVVKGFLPKPGSDWSSTSSSAPDKTFIFINNRPVHQKEIMKLVRQHYSAQYVEDAARHRFPIIVLKITVSPSSVDVNLTPDKTQVLLQNKEVVLTAVEALLVSLYGSQPGSDAPAEQQLVHATPLPPLSPLQINSSCLENEGRSDVTNRDDDVLKEAQRHGGSEAPAASLELQASSCSSSSSVADDWVIDQIPADVQSDPSVSDQSITEAGSGSRSPDKPAAAQSRKTQISAEAWSRGTALTDPVSGGPLQPVVVFQPSKPTSPDSGETVAQRSPSKKMLKPAALTAYHMMNNHTVRAPPSAATLFEKEVRAEIQRGKPTGSLEDVSAAVHERWDNLKDEARNKYKEKAKKSLELYHQKTRLTSAEGPKGSSDRTPMGKPQGQKRKAPLSNQQLLDQLFSAQSEKKRRSPGSKPRQLLPCSVAALRLQLQRLSSHSAAVPRGLRLINRLASQSTWVTLCGQRLMLFNPFRAEEALLFKRLLENNVLPVVSLQKPVQLTDGSLGGTEYVEALCNMEKQNPDLNGSVVFSDPRLVANGFQIKLTAAERHLEVTAMADCVPFLGVEDLREILTAVLHRKASTVQESRPLKITNYLKAQAVRLARQLPTSLSLEDVDEIIGRMERQLDGSSWTCIHSRPFLQPLSDVPSTEEEAKALFRPLDL